MVCIKIKSYDSALKKLLVYCYMQYNVCDNSFIGVDQIDNMQPQRVVILSYSFEILDSPFVVTPTKANNLVTQGGIASSVFLRRTQKPPNINLSVRFALISQ